jgi:drug/metabolite transporter (DMT)-like permease
MREVAGDFSARIPIFRTKQTASQGYQADHARRCACAREKLTNKNAYFALAIAALFWSGNHIVGRAIAGHFPPLTISTIRWFIPAIILWIAGRSSIEQDWPLIRRHWAIMLWLGSTGGILFTALQYVGLQYTSAVNVSILNSLVPVLIIAASALIFLDGIFLAQLLGILTSLIEVLIIVTNGRLDALLHLSFNHGDVIIIANMIVFAIYAACLRLGPKIHWKSFLFMFAVISAIGTMPFAIFELVSGRIPELNSGTIAAVAYV